MKLVQDVHSLHRKGEIMSSPIDDYIGGEAESLKTFIYDDCVSEAEYEEKVNFAVDKTISNIVHALKCYHEQETSKIKEACANKIIENQQAIMAQFASLLTKTISSKDSVDLIG